MKTEFAKAIEAGEDVVGKEVVCINDDGWVPRFVKGEVLVVHSVMSRFITFTNETCTSFSYANDFEFKHVLYKQREAESDKLLPEENKRLKQQIQMLKDDLFNLQMENARLDLAAQRWQMFDCEANRNIADKLLKKLADEAVENSIKKNEMSVQHIPNHEKKASRDMTPEEMQNAPFTYQSPLNNPQRRDVYRNSGVLESKWSHDSSAYCTGSGGAISKMGERK